MAQKAIFFESLYNSDDYSNKLEISLKDLEKEKYFQEAWHLEIALKNLNFFEKVEQPGSIHPGNRQSLADSN